MVTDVIKACVSKSQNIEFLSFAYKITLPESTAHCISLYFYLFIKDSHRFGKNIQKAMVDIMGLFQPPKNCTKWFGLLPPSKLPSLGWKLFWTANESKVCKNTSWWRNWVTSSWSSMKTIAMVWMFHEYFFLVVWKHLVPQRATFAILYISREEVYHYCTKACIF